VQDRTVREFTPDDIPAVARLKQAIFGPRRASEDDIRYKYFSAGWSRSTGHVVVAQGEVGGFLGRIWRPFLADGRLTWWTAPGDLMLKPELRGLGLRQELARLGSEQALELGSVLNVSFPNRVAQRDMVISRRYWGKEATVRHPAFMVDTYARIVRPGPLNADIGGAWFQAFARRAALQGMSLRRARATGSALKLDVARELPEDVAQLWERLGAQARFQTARTAEYLAWRYEEDPRRSFRFISAHRNGELAGVAIVSDDVLQGAHGLVVVDWLAPRSEPEALQSMLNTASDLARADSQVSFMFSAALPADSRAFASAGFWRLPNRVTPHRMLFTCREPAPGWASHAELKTADNWFLNPGDNDVF
jgi:hypothetical protein